MTEYNDTPASKTRRKQDMQELQEVGLTLMELKPAQQARLPLNDPLRNALDEARRISNLDARRRHALFVGRLISDSGPDALLQALATLTDPTRQQRLQQWTEQVIACENVKGLEPILHQVLEFHPHGDRQSLRNQARNLVKARLDNPADASAEQRDRFKRERKKFQALLNDLEKTAPLY
ncbi:hypothetical protein CEK62_11295 [Alcanivorax sp. N3-2A]|nr:hypothetical protein CEK62_11295 [Alcanivorax sp. N3-2A]|tara:strand:+ start:34167 stop:34703 length:537 start_codon:yes stop_codon:yes gene_type:complete